MAVSKTWWGQRFLEAVERFTDPARLSRGRSYANNGKILEWAIQPGQVVATVRGSVNPYFGVYKEPRYTTKVQLAAIDGGRWGRIVAAIGSRASLVTPLLMGEVPGAIEAPFEAEGVHLLPHRTARPETQCSCPDYANPCKHVAGVYYVLAAAFDRDPFLMFALRGLPREALMGALRSTPLGAALAADMAEAPPELTPEPGLFPALVAEAAPERVSGRGFWQGAVRLEAEVPELVPPAVPALTIKREGDHPAFWTRDDSFIEAMEDVYARVRRRLS